jgi:serine/threonine-protein kinase
MAEVFRAVKQGPEGWEKPIALKRILPHLADNEAFINMLSAEARLHAQLDHPNLVQVLDFFRQGETYMLAMEYVAGRNLRALMKEKGNPLSWEAGVHIISEVLKGLDFAHKRRGPQGPLQIVHRDISPQNILISYDGIVKLSDFGIAQANIEREKTESGVLKGKQRYLSPEQLRSHTADARSDLFSTAVILYELICHRHPFESDSDFETMRRIVSGQYTKSDSLRSDVPDPIHEAIRRGLSTEPGKRFADAAKFRQALLSVQNAAWLSNGTDRLKQWMAHTYPKPSDREEPAIEKTPFLTTGGIPASVGQETISGVADISIGGARRSILAPRRMVFFSIALAGFLSALYLFHRQSPAPMTSASPVKIPTDFKGSLQIDGPSGTEVYIAGKWIGRLPLGKYELKADSYMIMLSFRGKQQMTRVTIEPGETTLLDWSDAR